MEQYLWQNKILFKDYAQPVKKISDQVKQGAVAPFVEQKLPVVYLRGGNEDKEGMAQTIAAKRGITSGDVCALSSLEPSPTFEHYGTHMVARTRDLSLSDRSGMGVDECANSELVSDERASLFERTGMAGAANGPGEFKVLPAGQLLSLVAGLWAGGSDASGSTQDGLVEAVAGDCRSAESSPRGDFPELPH